MKITTEVTWLRLPLLLLRCHRQTQTLGCCHQICWLLWFLCSAKRHWVTQIPPRVELALVKLYRATQKKISRALELVTGRTWPQICHWLCTWTDWRDTAYAQDVVPVKQQKEITGHAVRAMYMYTGAADVAIKRAMWDTWTPWNSLGRCGVSHNVNITGGIGSSVTMKAFSVDYELPNENTTAKLVLPVGMVFWNQRMNQLTGDAKYIDVFGTQFIQCR